MNALPAAKPRKLQLAGWITHLTFALLLASFCVWQLTRPGGPAYLFWLIQCIPLLLFIPGMLQQKPRTYIWLCFVILLYFVKAVEGLFTPEPVWIDFVLLGCSVVLFIGAMLTSRWLQQYINP